jgi:hypothetical protein
MDKNRELAELLGIPWHRSVGDYCEICGHYSCMEDNPDFAADPRLVLRKMDKHPEGRLFYAQLIYGGGGDDGLIPRGYILDTTGLLRDKAVDFLKVRKS